MSEPTEIGKLVEFFHRTNFIETTRQMKGFCTHSLIDILLQYARFQKDKNYQNLFKGEFVEFFKSYCELDDDEFQDNGFNAREFLELMRYEIEDNNDITIEEINDKYFKFDLTNPKPSILSKTTLQNGPGGM